MAAPSARRSINVSEKTGVAGEVQLAIADNGGALLGTGVKAVKFVFANPDHQDAYRYDEGREVRASRSIDWLKQISSVERRLRCGTDIRNLVWTPQLCKYE